MSIAAKQYLQEIERKIPCSRPQKKKFLKQFENDVLLYCEEHDNVSVSMLEMQFGTPEELANDFLPEINTQAVRGYVRTERRTLVFLVAILILVVVIISGVEIYSRYKQSKLMGGEYIEEITYVGDITPYVTIPTYCKENIP